MQPCIGFLEYLSIGKGIEAADLILKNTAIDTIISSPNCPGRYHILFSGDVDAVKTAVEMAKEIKDETMLESCVIPNIDRDIIQAVFSPVVTDIQDGVAIFETITMTETVLGADNMLDTADVDIVDLRLGKGLAGKSYVIVTGSLQDLEYAVDAAVDGMQEKELLISAVVIPSINPELIKFLVRM